MSEHPLSDTCFNQEHPFDEDYYIAVPPDPTDSEMEGVWATLRGLREGDS